MISDSAKKNFWIFESLIILFMLIGIAFGKWSAWFGQYGWIASLFLVICSLFVGMVIGIAAYRLDARIDHGKLNALTLSHQEIEDSLKETRELYKLISMGVIDLAINRVANKIAAKYVPNMSQDDVREAILKVIDEIVSEEMCDVRRIFEEQLDKSGRERS